MNETPIIIAGLISVAAVVVAAVIIFGRLKVEQQRTVQKLLDKDDGSRPELTQALGSLRRGDNDLRRGVLLIASGLIFTLTFFFVGGIAWIFGAVPVTIGLVYLLFWRMNAARA
jgi:hypothetical protein